VGKGGGGPVPEGLVKGECGVHGGNGLGGATPFPGKLNFSLAMAFS